MRTYTAATLNPFLAAVQVSNLSSNHKDLAQRLVQDVLQLQAQQAQHQEQHLNQTLNQPSSKKPEWAKGEPPKPDPPRRKKHRLGGRRPGAGNRSKPDPDRSLDNLLPQCPHCGTDLAAQQGLDVQTRIVEDIEPPPEKTILTEEISEVKWCPTCKKKVGAPSQLALPRSDIGLHATVLIVYLWVVSALSLPKIRSYLSVFRRLDLSTSGLSKLLIRLADLLTPVAQEILHDIRDDCQVWADETGWRVRGVTWWLWAFANQSSADYYAAPSRGSPLVSQILGPAFLGILITDAWAAYNVVDCLRQTCMAHLLRKIRRLVRDYPELRSLLRLYTRLKQILCDGQRLQRRQDLSDHAFERAHERLQDRLDQLLAWKNPNPILARFLASLRRQRDRILTFVLLPGCPNHNNFAEYIIRKGVLKRKVSGGSMSPRGAQAYAILISIAQTCHLRQISFRSFLLASLRHYCRTGKPLLLSQYASLLQQHKTAA